MKIKQLGNGGAFDYNMTNSSFLIETEEKEYILFDCGYNVYSELRKQHKSKDIDLNNLKYVFISHMDDDHMGSLKTLIYYTYFMLNKRIHILCCNKVYDDLVTYLSDIDGFIDYGIKITTNLFTIENVTNRRKISKEMEIYPIPAKHFKPCYGLQIFFKQDECKKNIIISADTKYNENISTASSINTLKIFHDYSNWDNENMQVHCCYSDMQKYENIVKDKIQKYHTGESFNSEWMVM